jgi:hypothetical protein
MAQDKVSSMTTAAAGGGVTLISMAIEYALNGFPKPVPVWAITMLATVVATIAHVAFNLLKKKDPTLAQAIAEAMPGEQSAAPGTLPGAPTP